MGGLGNRPSLALRVDVHAVVHANPKRKRGTRRGTGLAGLAGALLVTAVLVPVAGCGGQRPYGEVQGTVTLDGQPLANVEVVFLPDPEKANTGKRSVALTDAQGRYRLSSDAGREGAPVGFHRVCINDLLAGPPGVATGPPLVEPTARPAGAPGPAAQHQEERRSRFPPEYGSALSTPLRDIEIKPGSQRIDLDVHRQLPP
jgi:hypothetical protein